MSDAMNAETNPVTGESPAESTFRERTQARLNAEKAGQTTEPSPEDFPQEEARQPEAAPAEELLEQPTETEEPDEGAVTESDPDEYREEIDPTTTVEYWQESAHKAEEARSNMERDYRVKTHKIAATRREFEETAALAITERQYLVNEAREELGAWQGVDWTALQTQPEQYQRAQQAYTKVAQKVQKREQALQNIYQKFNEKVEQMKEQEAAVSRDILKARDGWGDDRIPAIKEFAVKEGYYTPEGFDDLTDWRIMTLLDVAEKAQSAPKSLKDVKPIRKGKPPATAKNKAPAPNRDAQGRFKAAQENSFANPGDRQAFRQSKLAQLQAERKARGF